MFEQREIPIWSIHRDMNSEGQMKVPIEFESIIADVEKLQEPLPSHYLQTELMKARTALGKDLDADLNASRKLAVGCIWCQKLVPFDHYSLSRN
jgi:hypothetical protein